MTASGRRAFVFVYALSGAAGLVYEVAWTRLLTLQLGHTVAAASTVLAAFMGGLAIGAWIAGNQMGGRATAANALRAYVALEIFIALAALLLPVALPAFVPTLAWAYADGTSPDSLLARTCRDQPGARRSSRSRHGRDLSDRNGGGGCGLG